MPTVSMSGCLQEQENVGGWFVGLWLPDDVSAALSRDTVKLESIEGVVVARQPHVTMAFLGDVPDAVVPILGERLARLAVRIRPLHLMIDGRGAFPNRNRPRVLW